MVVRPYKGISADERRAERRARLLEAGLDVIGDRGIAGMTMTAVCERAGLTERYFYESFRNRDELLAAVIETFSAATDDEVLERVARAPEDLLERARAAVGGWIEALSEDPRLARAFVEAVSSDAVKAHRAREIDLYAGALALEMRTLAGVRGNDAKVRMVTTTLVAGTAEVVTRWLDGEIELTREELVEVCARMCVAAVEAVR